MYNFEEIKKALEPYKGSISGGVFPCIGSDSPDQFNTIYNKDCVLIMHNTYYDYLDVVGLSEEHFKEVYEMCRFDWEAEQARQKEEWKEVELLTAAEPVNHAISIMTSYFMGDINENELIGLLMTATNNNKYVKEHVLNIITDKQ
jgi:hypothetical protein